jgi:hypothetical protein
MDQKGLRWKLPPLLHPLDPVHPCDSSILSPRLLALPLLRSRYGAPLRENLQAALYISPVTLASGHNLLI